MPIKKEETSAIIATHYKIVTNVCQSVYYLTRLFLSLTTKNKLSNYEKIIKTSK